MHCNSHNQIQNKTLKTNVLLIEEQLSDRYESFSKHCSNNYIVLVPESTFNFNLADFGTSIEELLDVSLFKLVFILEWFNSFAANFLTIQFSQCHIDFNCKGHSGKSSL